MTQPVDPPSARGLVQSIRRTSLAHPRLRLGAREGWAVVRRAGRLLHLPPLLEPPELEELHRLDAGTHRASAPRPRILFVSFRGWSTHLMWETTFALAARLRNADPVFAICGGRLPVCDAANIHASPPMPCMSCGGYARDALHRAGFQPLAMHDMVDVRSERAEARRRLAGIQSLADLQRFEDAGMPLGEMVRISVLWFLARGTLDDSEEVVRTYRRFLESSQLVVRYFGRLLDTVAPDRVFTLNGSFFAERILVELARRRRIPVVTYERGYLTDTVVLSTGQAACDYLIEEPFWRDARDRPLDAAEESELDDYLGARTRGERAVDNIWRERTEGWTAIAREIGLAPGRRFLALFSNVVWDSAAQDKDLAFPSLPQWLVETIRGMADRPEVDLVVRLHPAEVRTENHRTRERMADAVRTAFPRLPENVHVIPPESTVSSYALMDRCLAGLVYTSTVGLEMAVRGYPVIVAARTHYRGRGFTTDVTTPEEYWRAIDEAIAEPSGDAVTRDRRRTLARRYAHLFFFRYMQHLSQVTETGRARPHLGFTSVDELAPGRDPTLDRVLSGIIRGEPVVAPAAR